MGISGGAAARKTRLPPLTSFPGHASRHLCARSLHLLGGSRKGGSGTGTPENLGGFAEGGDEREKPGGQHGNAERRKAGGTPQFGSPPGWPHLAVAMLSLIRLPRVFTINQVPKVSSSPLALFLHIVRVVGCEIYKNNLKSQSHI